ncbi:MAG: UDP-2,4-diacetamido-2,4,6-trideoxy-beta-L-altropyranose hydrolase [Sulfurimonas sp.]|nr:MAG: UDP-2,4-diacetamido-2,4,6-trideoxy-beta-L-altropyranose hydrolase [Sulfurimonas sp.]
MPKYNIIFRADSSFKIGIGHIKRDLVLASFFSKSKITFACLNLDGNINHEIVEAAYSVDILKSNTKEELCRLIKHLEADLLIIDHYDIDYDFETYIKENTKTTILCFDDTYQKHNCDILLNHNIYANEKKYKNLVPKETILLCGNKHTLLREEFYNELNKTKQKLDNKYKTIFLAMGGSDHSNINIKILKTLKNFKNIKVNLVTNSSNKNLQTLKQYSNNKKWINLHINSNKIAQIMRQSDFAIVSPSLSANEVYFMGLDFIAIQTAKNQSYMYRYLKKKKFLVMKSFKQKDLNNYIHKMLTRLNYA